VDVEDHKLAYSNQALFLTNNRNKQLFIRLLSSHLQHTSLLLEAMLIHSLLRQHWICAPMPNLQQQHYAVMTLHMLTTEVLQPCDWGWHSVHGKGLRPTTTDKQYAPEHLCKLVACKCKYSAKQPCSTQLCSCRKHGLSCVKACLHCGGEGCANSSKADNEVLYDAPSDVEEFDDNDMDNDVQLFFGRTCRRRNCTDHVASMTGYSYCIAVIQCHLVGVCLM